MSGIAVSFVPSALGDIAVAMSGRGFVALALPAPGGREQTLWALLAHVPTARLDAPDRIRDAPPSSPLFRAITRGLEGDRDALVSWGALPIDLDALPPFRARVYTEARAVPAGSTASYGQIAERVGSPGAMRAVGQALAENPLPLVVPCHRVIAKGGALTGFSAPGGVDTKAHLLALERAAIAGLPWVPDARVIAPAKPFSAAPTWTGDAPPPYDVRLACRTLAASDPVLARALATFGSVDLRFRPSDSTFEALASAIVYQQLSGKAASTILRRLVALCSGDGPLRAADVRKVPDEALRAAGLSGSKLASIRDLAERERRGDLPSIDELQTLPDEDVIERLTRVRGIGRWSAEIFLLFRLGRPDVLPLADLGIKKGFQKLFGPKGDLADAAVLTPRLVRRGERWRPYRSIASLLLWRVLDG